jgi:hypothetical protein
MDRLRNHCVTDFQTHLIWILWLSTWGDTYEPLFVHLLTTLRLYSSTLWTAFTLSATTPVSLNLFDGPRYDGSKHVFEKDIYSTSCKCFRAVIRKGSFWGPMFIRTSCIVLQCRNNPRSLYRPFRYTPYSLGMKCGVYFKDKRASSSDLILE